MENASYIALSQQKVLVRQMDLIANNVANASTTAYKGEHSLFAQQLVEVRGAVNPSTVPGTDKIAYVFDQGVVRDMTDGALTTTDNPLDLAIAGDGFFELDTPAGRRYTRNGMFQLDSDGQLVNGQGFPVMGEDGRPIVIEDTATIITIDRTGSITTEAGQGGRVKLVQFADPRRMLKSAGGLYETDQEPVGADGLVTAKGDTRGRIDAKRGEIHQGMLEGSNVNPIAEISRMLGVMRSYQSAQKFIEAENERMRKAIRTLPATKT